MTWFCLGHVHVQIRRWGGGISSEGLKKTLQQTHAAVHIQRDEKADHAIGPGTFLRHNDEHVQHIFVEKRCQNPQLACAPPGPSWPQPYLRHPTSGRSKAIESQLGRIEKWCGSARLLFHPMCTPRSLARSLTHIRECYFRARTGTLDNKMTILLHSADTCFVW